MEGINTLGERLAHPGGSLPGRYVYAGLCFSFLALRPPAEFPVLPTLLLTSTFQPEPSRVFLMLRSAQPRCVSLEQAAEKPALGARGCRLPHQRLPVDFHVPHLF